MKRSAHSVVSRSRASQEACQRCDRRARYCSKSASVMYRPTEVPSAAWSHHVAWKTRVGVQESLAGLSRAETGHSPSARGWRPGLRSARDTALRHRARSRRSTADDVARAPRRDIRVERGLAPALLDERDRPSVRGVLTSRCAGAASRLRRIRERSRLKKLVAERQRHRVLALRRGPRPARDLEDLRVGVLVVPVRDAPSARQILYCAVPVTSHSETRPPTPAAVAAVRTPSGSEKYSARTAVRNRSVQS